jgi:tRNA pseudouridine38-40 synthase
VRTLKITLAYEGTDLVGWQRQPEGASVQAALEEALARLQGPPVAAIGAGRTDAGVHAAGQVASARVDFRHDVETIRRALNAALPEAVRVLEVADAPDAFHARFSAQSKTYHYRVTNGPVVSPFARRWTWHVPWTLDIAAMQAAAAHLAGEHDFAAFQSVGSDIVTTVRRLHESRLVEVAAGGRAAVPGVYPEATCEGRLLVYEVRGTGFLRHMVRAIVGTLVEVGSGRLRPEDVAGLLEHPDRTKAGPTAPACGLCLASVEYESSPGDGEHS